MHRKIVWFGLVVSSLVLTLAGCAAKSTVQGQQIAAPTQEVKKIFVLIDDKTNLSDNRVLKKSFDLIAQRLPVVMNLNGYEAVVVNKSELAKSSEKSGVTNLLFLQPASTHFRSSGGSSSTVVKISATMTEIVSKKTLWTGEISFTDSEYAKFDDEAGDLFSKNLLIALRNAQILKLPTPDPVLPKKK